MEGPGGEPPGTAAHRGSRGLREPPPSGLRRKRLPRPGSGTLRWGFAGLLELPTGLCGRIQPGYGTFKRSSAVAFSRAPGRSDRDPLRGSAGLRDAPPGLCCGAQPGSGTLRRDFALRFSRAPGRGSGTPSRGSAEGCGAATSLRRGSAPLRSRAPLLRSGTLLRAPRLCARAGRAPPLPAAGSQWRGAGSALPAPSCLPWHLPRPHLPGLRAFSCLLLLPPGHGALGAGAAPLPAPTRDRRRRRRELNGTRRFLYGENEARPRLLRRG
ncbi:uncharacterized protein LOC119698180 isoform X2 [Motacilla alba alba]|uniref:uncharacterized protein LOC119698180 isoform X2 n=1 Tax=Motacilla alba alba TaxID=1094192 RepID=UPI0018D504C5|nr:uncharacterized protein LOC119698180 isoform X2 [Motacilla alba alba]